MSTSIDNRVVQMTFNNKSFEKGVDETLKTLDKLNEKLKFQDASKGFDNIEQASEDVQFTQLSKNVQSLADRFSGLGIIGMQIWSKIGDSIWDLITGPFKKLAGVIDGVENQIKTGGWNRALNLDKASNMLINLGQGYDAVNKTAEKTMITMEDGSSKEVWNRYKAINEAVDGTAYSFDEAALASANFLAVNEDLSNEDLKKVLRASQGLAATYSKDFSQISSKLQKIQAAGHLTQDVVSELRMQGIAIEPIMQKYLGIVGATSEEMADLYKTGAITYDMVVDALYNKFNNSLDKANNTFEGATNNMRSAMSRIGAAFYEPMMGSLIKGANQVRIFMNGIKDVVNKSGFAETISGTVEKAINKIDELFFFIDKEGNKKLNKNGSIIIGNLTNYFTGFSYIVKSVVEILSDFGKAFYEVFLKGADDGAKKSGNFSNKMKDLFDTIVKNKDKIIDAFKGFLYVLKPFVKLAELLLKIGLKLLTLALKIAVVIIGIVGNIITLVVESKIFQKILNGIKTGLEKVSKWLKNVKGYIADFFGELKLGEKITKIFWDVIDAIEDFVNKYHPLQTALEAIETGFNNIWNAIRFVIEKFGDLIGVDINIPTLDEIGDKIKDFRDSVVHAFEDPKGAADNLMDKLSELKDFLGGKFSTVAEEIGKKFETFKDWLDKFTGGFGDAQKSMEDFSNSDGLEKTEEKVGILERIGNAMDKFAQGLDFIWNTFKTIGKYIVDGFKWAFEELGSITGVTDFKTFLEFIKDVIAIIVKYDFGKMAYGIGTFFSTVSESMKMGMGKGTTSTLKTLPDAMLKIAAALAIMALVVGAIGAMKPEAVEQAKDMLGYLTVLAVVMALVIKKLGSLKADTTSAIEMVTDGGKNIKVSDRFATSFAKAFGNKFGTAAELAAAGALAQGIGLAMLELLAGVALVARVVTDFNGKVRWPMLAAGLTAVAIIMAGLGIFMKIILKSLKATTADQSIKEFAKGGAKGYGKTYLKTDKTDKVDTSTPAGAIAATALLIMSVASAVLVLSIAVAALGALPLSVITQGGIAVVAIMGIMIGLMAALTALMKKVKTSSGSTDKGLMEQFIGIAVALLALSLAVTGLIPAIVAMGLLMKKDPAMVWLGIAGVAVVGLLASICAFIAGKAKNGVAAALSLIGMAIVLGVTLSQIRKLASDSDVNLDKLAAAIGGLVAILLMMSLLIFVAGKVDKALETALVIGSVALAIFAIGESIEKVGKLKLGEAIQGVVGILVLIVGMTVILNLLSKFSSAKMDTFMVALGAAFVGIGAGVFLLAAAFKLLYPLIDDIYGKRDSVRAKLEAFADIIAAVLVHFIAALLESLANESLYLINSLGRLLLNILIGIVDFVAGNAIQIGTAVGHLMAALVVVVAAALATFVGDLIDVIMEALGIHSPSTVFATIGINIIKGLINGIQAMISALSELIVELFGIIIDYVRKPLEWLYNKGKDIVQGLIDGIEDTIEFLKTAVGKVFGAISGFVTYPLKFLFKIGQDILQGLIDGVNDVIDGWKNVIEGIFNFVTTFFDDPKKALQQLGEDLIEGLKNGVEIATKPLRTAVNTVKDLFEDLKDLSDGASTKIADTAYDIVNAKEEARKKENEKKQLQAKYDAGAALTTYLAKGGGYELLKDFKDNLKWLENNATKYARLKDVNSAEADSFRREYEASVRHVAKQYEQYNKEISNIGSTYGSALLFDEADTKALQSLGFKTLFQGIGGWDLTGRLQSTGQILGKDLALGFNNGLMLALSKGAGNKYPTALQTFKDLKSAVQSFWGVNSPSKVMKWVGQMLGIGFNIGLEDTVPKSIEIFSAAIDGIEDISSEAQITPVFNLEDLQNGANAVATTIAGVSATVPAEVDLMNNTNQEKLNQLNGAVSDLTTNMSNADLIAKIADQNNIITALADKLNSMGVYIDGKTLVGSVLSDIDKGLGMRVGQVGRSVRA